MFQIGCAGIGWTGLLEESKGYTSRFKKLTSDFKIIEEKKWGKEKRTSKEEKKKKRERVRIHKRLRGSEERERERQRWLR